MSHEICVAVGHEASTLYSAVAAVTHVGECHALYIVFLKCAEGEYSYLLFQ